MTTVSYHATVKDLQGLAFSGSGAGPGADSGGPFARPGWFALLEAHGARPFVLLARNAGGALVLPLMRGAAGLEILANWYAFTWRPLVTPGADVAALLGAAARDLARRERRIALARLPDDRWPALLAAAFRAAGWAVGQDICDTNRFLAPAGRSYADYLAARPGPLRTALKRKAGKFDIHIINDFSADLWQEYEDIYAHSWKPEEGDPALLRRFAQAEGAAGRLRLGLARHGGAAVAAQFWTVEGGTAFIHKLAHRESARALSPGTVLTAAMMERVIDHDRVAEVDFGTGDDPYKRDWMDDIRPRHRLDCWRPGDPRNWPAMGRAALRTLVSRPIAG